MRAIVKDKVPPKHRVMLPAIEKLVSETGFSRTKVIEKLELPLNFFSLFREAGKLYLKSRAQFAENIMGITVDNLAFSSQDRRYLLDKLRPHENSFKIVKPKDAKGAAKTLGDAMLLFAQGDISKDQLQQIRSSCQIFSDLMVSTELQERVLNLEELMKKNSK